MAREAHKSLDEAARALLAIADEGGRTDDERTALLMGARRLLARHIQKHRRLERRQAPDGKAAEDERRKEGLA